MSTPVATEHRSIRTETPDPLYPLLFRVHKIRSETYDTFTLDLTAAKEGEEFSFLPGQFNMLYAFGVGEVPISISGDPTKSGTLVHTTRAVGTVTRVMKKLKVGDIIGVRGPYGTAWPVEEAAGNDIVIVAGGIGLAPLRPALYYILANRSRYGKVALLYGTRTPDDIIYRKELETLRARFDLDVQVTVDRSAANWRGNVGVVTNLIPKIHFDPDNTISMICGPEIMMRFTILGLQKRDVPLESIYLTMERNMKCAVGFCGHCQLGPMFICKDGPVFRYDKIKQFFLTREI